VSEDDVNGNLKMKNWSEASIWEYGIRFLKSDACIDIWCLSAFLLSKKLQKRRHVAINSTLLTT